MINSGATVDKSLEIAELRNDLSSIQLSIKEKIKKINEIKTKIGVGYRHHDRQKYEAERREIAKSLWEYEIEMDKIKAKIKELEA